MGLSITMLPVDLRRSHFPPGYTRGRSTPIVMLWWWVNATLFRWTPRWCHRWRCFLLRTFGARIGKGVRIRESVLIHFPWRLQIGDYASIGADTQLYSLDEICIGSHTSISQDTLLCTGSHDYEDPYMCLITKPIRIGDGVWVGADVFVAPGVNIGDLCVIGARSSVFKDMPAGYVCHGYPCQPKRLREIRPMPEDAGGASQ
jgi:putative colanic acid biosynthesis acetyltransferase WcaF